MDNLHNTVVMGVEARSHVITDGTARKTPSLTYVRRVTRNAARSKRFSESKDHQMKN